MACRNIKVCENKKAFAISRTPVPLCGKPSERAEQQSSNCTDQGLRYNYT
jgi:ubiquitin